MTNDEKQERAVELIEYFNQLDIPPDEAAEVCLYVASCIMVAAELEDDEG